MSAAAESNRTPELVPFFVDARSVREKLNAEQRDWIPTRPGSLSELAGLVLETGTYFGLEDRENPTLRVLDADGIEWSAIAFHGFLRRAIEQQKPRAGDWIAVAFLGTKAARKKGESDAYVYRLVVERNPDGRVAPELVEPDTAQLPEPEPEQDAEPDHDGIPF